jgi:hypothetical protein
MEFGNSSADGWILEMQAILGLHTLLTTGMLASARGLLLHLKQL